jgi:hypothetical protein
MFLRSKYLLLIAPPILVSVAGEMLMVRFGAAGPGYQKLHAAAPPEALATEQSARITMISFLLLLVFVAAGAVIKFVADVLKEYRGVERLKPLAAAAIGMIFAAIVIARTESGELQSGFKLLGDALFERAGMLSGTPSALDSIRSMVMIANIASAAGIVALVVGAISCLGETGEDREANWKRQSERLQLYVYVSTALLVSGILFLEAWSHWPQFAFILDDKQKSVELAAYSSHANALTIFNGVQYSVMLAAYAIPVAAVLFRQADEIARSKLGPGDHSMANVEKKKTDEGLSITIMNQIKALVMIIMPFLASTFDKLLGLLGG